MTERLRNELRALLDEQKADIVDMMELKSSGKRVDALTLICRKVFRATTLCYVDGVLRYFAGDCYDRVGFGDLVYSFGDMLMDMGVSPTEVRKMGTLPYSVIHDRDFRSGPLLCFTNGVLDLGGTASKKNALEDYRKWSGDGPDDDFQVGCFTKGFSPDLIVTERMPYAYNPKATCPTWDRFIEEVLPNEAERKCLQEFFGMVYLDREKLSVEKFALLVGKGANGKSVVFEVIKRVLGPDNVSTMDSSQLMDEKMIPSLVGKRLNFAPDMRSTAVFDSTLKALASGQDVTGRKIYGDAQKVKAPPLCFALNEMPRFTDGSPAFFRRILLFSFDKRIPPDRQDRKLTEKICAKDLPGVFNWIVEGYRRLERQKGNFTRCEKMEMNVGILKNKIDHVLYPVATYLLERGLTTVRESGAQKPVTIDRAEIERHFRGALNSYRISREMTKLGAKTYKSGGKTSYLVYEIEKESQIEM